MVKAFADAGLLNKYCNYESFQLSCQSRGIRVGVAEMWEEFRGLSLEKKKEYFKTLKENSVAALKRATKKLTKAK